MENKMLDGHSYHCHRIYSRQDLYKAKLDITIWQTIFYQIHQIREQNIKINENEERKINWKQKQEDEQFEDDGNQIA